MNSGDKFGAIFANYCVWKSGVKSETEDVERVLRNQNRKLGRNPGAVFIGLEITPTAQLEKLVAGKILTTDAFNPFLSRHE